MKRILALFMTLMVMGMMAGSLVSAALPGLAPVAIAGVKINSGDVLDPNEDYSVVVLGVHPAYSFEEGESFKVKVNLINEFGPDADDVEVEVSIEDYDGDEDSSASVELDMNTGNAKWVTLEMTLPSDLKEGLDSDTFLLKLEVKESGYKTRTSYMEFGIEQTDYALEITDVDFTPGTTLKAGHALLTKVSVKNVGEEDLEDVKVVVEIPGLGVRASDYVGDDDDELKSGEKTRTDEDEDELYLKVPVCTKAGDYTVKVSVEHDDGVVTESHTLTVLANEVCKVSDVDGTTPTSGKLVLTVGPDNQNVVVGKQAVYPLALTNAGKTAKTYVLELSAGAWGTAKMSDNLVVLAPGESKVVYAYVTPGDGALMGQNTATLTLKSDGTVLKTIDLKANVVGKEKPVSLRNGLEIALIVLVVVLVVIGLILGFSRLRKDRDEDDFEDEEGKNYY